MELRPTEDADFVDPRGDKYFRFARTKKGPVDSRDSGATRRESFKGAREAPPRNKRIMWTRFDVFEYLISRAASHHSLLTTDQTLAAIQVELTKDHVIREVNIGLHD